MKTCSLDFALGANGCGMEMRLADLMKRHQKFGGNLPLSQIGSDSRSGGLGVGGLGRRNTEKGKRSWPVALWLARAAHDGCGKQ